MINFVFKLRMSIVKIYLTIILSCGFCDQSWKYNFYRYQWLYVLHDQFFITWRYLQNKNFGLGALFKSWPFLIMKRKWKKFKNKFDTTDLARGVLVNNWVVLLLCSVANQAIPKHFSQIRIHGDIFLYSWII